MEKNIKTKDMRVIARKKIQREIEDAGRASAFRLRKRSIPEPKIDRFIEAHKLGQDTEHSDARMSHMQRFQSPRVDDQF